MLTKLHTKTRISVLLPTFLTEEIKKVSEQENITQSYIVKGALEKWMQEKLQKDTKELSQINFDDLPSEDEWVNIQPKIN